jgi:methylenetetrahydrofolate reductase (NADPH)
MNQFNNTDIKMTDLLSQSKFTISAEVIPPRNGAPQEEILMQIDSLVKSGAQFLSVTKGAGGSLRGGSLPIAQVIKDHFKKPVIAHFTCRDLTPEEVENQLMDHHYFGVRNILALRGDPPQGVPDWKANPKSYSHAYQLIDQIQKLNSGEYYHRDGFKSGTTKTDFCIGAAAYPDDEAFDQRVGYFLQKYQAGAKYGITQMVYDIDSYAQFLEELSKNKCDIPVLVGTRVLKTQKQAMTMKQRFGIKIPDWYYKALPETENKDKAYELFLELAEGFKKTGAPGIHVFVLTDTELSCKAIKKLHTPF